MKSSRQFVVEMLNAQNPYALTEDKKLYKRLKEGTSRVMREVRGLGGSFQESTRLKLAYEAFDIDDQATIASVNVSNIEKLKELANLFGTGGEALQRSPKQTVIGRPDYTLLTYEKVQVNQNLDKQALCLVLLYFYDPQADRLSLLTQLRDTYSALNDKVMVAAIQKKLTAITQEEKLDYSQSSARQELPQLQVVDESPKAVGGEQLQSSPVGNKQELLPSQLVINLDPSPPSAQLVIDKVKREPSPPPVSPPTVEPYFQMLLDMATHKTKKAQEQYFNEEVQKLPSNQLLKLLHFMNDVQHMNGKACEKTPFNLIRKENSWFWRFLGFFGVVSYGNTGTFQRMARKAKKALMDKELMGKDSQELIDADYKIVKSAVGQHFGRPLTRCGTTHSLGIFSRQFRNVNAGAVAHLDDKYENPLTLIK